MLLVHFSEIGADCSCVYVVLYVQYLVTYKLLFSKLSTLVKNRFSGLDKKA